MEDADFTALEAGVRRAEAHRSAGRFGDALTVYRELLAGRLRTTLRSSSPLVAADLVVVERLAELSVLFGQAEAADELLAGMAGLNLEARNRYGADWATLKRLHLALGRGELRHAYELLGNLAPSIGDVKEIDFSPGGLKSWEDSCRWPGAGPRHREVLFPALYLALGQLLAALGQYGNALSAVEAGLGHTTGANAPDLARRTALPLRLTRAAALLEKGQLQDARSELKVLEAELDARRHPGFAAQRLELVGKLGMLIGSYGPARQCFEEVLDLCQNGGFAAAGRTATLNLAHVLVLLNHTRQAEEWLHGVLDNAWAAGDQAVAFRAELLLSVARARAESLAIGVAITPVLEMWGSRRAQPPPARADETAAFPLDLPQAGSYLAWFEDRELAFRWNLSRDLAEAGKRCEEMIDVFRDTDSALIHSRLGGMIGLLAYYLGDPGRAETELRRVRPVLAELGLIPELWQVQRILGWCQAKLGRPAPEQQALARDTEALLARLADSLSGADRAVFLLNKWTAEEETLANQVDALETLEARRRRSFWPRRVGLRFQEMRRLDELLVHLDGHHRQLAERIVGGQSEASEVSQPVLLRRLVGHPRHRVTLVFLVLPDRVLIVRIGRFQLDFGVSPVTRIQVRDLVGRWHELMGATAGARDFTLIGAPPPPPDNTERARKLAAELSAELQLPAILETLPSHVDALRFALDDSLHGFPFAAMVHDRQYLARRWALSVALDTQTLPTAPRPSGSEALLVASPRGASEHGLTPLPGTRRELDEISTPCRALGLKARRLVDAEASKQAVLEHLPRSPLWHVACHGVFQPDEPDRSGLFLVPGDSEPELLSLRDLAHLDLEAVRHATLSSCWSADNFVLPGRRILSLPETLCRSGTGSVLSSLWPVDDEVAVRFMERFYRYLGESSRDRALQRVQLDCLDGQLGTSTDVTDPYFWAGFRLYGDPGRLRL